ncbi:hypothetical protein, partial [Escherichia coli]
HHCANEKCNQCGGRVLSALELSSTKGDEARFYRNGSMALMPVCCSIMASQSIRCCSSRKNFASSGDKSIVITRKAMRSNALRYRADGSYPLY